MQSLFAGWGRSWYDALQAKVERRFGLYQIKANYTWSKSLGMGHYRQVFGQVGSPGATPQDYYNLGDSKSFTNFDIPHVFNVLSAVDLPFGKGQEVPQFEQRGREQIGQRLDRRGSDRSIAKAR